MFPLYYGLYLFHFLLRDSLSEIGFHDQSNDFKTYDVRIAKEEEI